ncbi:MAG: DNA-binding transcriptional regulator [Spirochaetes bacterium]|nr:DNA-binding transcriptional regulator [Spirochaetota bacterium]
MKTGPDDSTIYRIARYYYAEDLSQEEIGAKEGFSRSQISRLIDRARDMGIVKICLQPPASLCSEELSQVLKKRLGLKSVLVVPVRKDASSEDIALAIATRAADRLSELLMEFDVVGLGWGHTVYKTAELLPRMAGKGGRPFFVPLIGISGDDNPDLQINTIIDRFGTAFRSKGFFINIPSVREKGAPISQMERQRVSALEERWKAVQAVVFGLGVPPSESPELIYELPGEYKEELKKSSSCGDILAHFFDAEGRLFEAEHGYELLAFEIERMARVERAICLAGGLSKGSGILAAARAGYMTDLMTDELTALELVRLLDKDPRRRKADIVPPKREEAL